MVARNKSFRKVFFARSSPEYVPTRDFDFLELTEPPCIADLELSILNGGYLEMQETYKARYSSDGDMKHCPAAKGHGRGLLDFEEDFLC